MDGQVLGEKPLPLLDCLGNFSPGNVLLIFALEDVSKVRRRGPPLVLFPVNVIYRSDVQQNFVFSYSLFHFSWNILH
jgi:hypothetical protein